jgi:hypothetical protein
MKRLILIVVAIFTGFSFKAQAQNVMNKVVEVVKPYEPTLSDAYKINSMPIFSDTSKVIPVFEHTIFSRRIDTKFDLRPITAAKMVPPTIPKLYKSYIKLGFGNYLTPMAELNINSLRSKDYALGLQFNHISSQGKVKLENNEKVFAGYSKTNAAVYGKKFFDQSLLQGEVSFSEDVIHQYGYNTHAVDTFFDKGDIKQKYSTLAINTLYKSTHNDSSRLSYEASLDYVYFKDLFNSQQNEVAINGSIYQRYKNVMLGADGNIKYINGTTPLDTADYSLVELSPWASKTTKDWRLTGGMKISFVSKGNTFAYLYPKIDFSFNVIEKVVVPYIGIDGKCDLNNYRKIAGENPYIKPGLPVKTSSSHWGIAGIKGSLNSKTSYNVSLQYALVKDMHFFVNDSVEKPGNTFVSLYDDAQVTTFSGELFSQIADKVDIRAKANFYQYNLDKQAKPWHMPSFDFTLAGSYNIRDKILLTLDAFAIGKRYAKVYNPIVIQKQLDGIIDLNLGIEYRYTKILSAFMKINNITGSQYYLWNQYPSQRLNFMLGFTYAL